MKKILQITGSGSKRGTVAKCEVELEVECVQKGKVTVVLPEGDFLDDDLPLV